MEIIILDADPVQAARSLIQEHIVKYIKYLKYTFVQCHYPNKTKYRKYFVESAKYSIENYIWFSEFYAEMNKLINSQSEVEFFNESLVFDCGGVSFKKKGLSLYPDSKRSLESYINASRLMYIKSHYISEIFPAGPPEWYVDKNCKIYEQYDGKQGKSFRIMNERNRLRYYIAEYFNQWVEIKDVPLEIDNFIRHLVYRRRKSDG